MSKEHSITEQTKLDLKKDLKHLYQPSAQKVVVVEIPDMNFLMIDGTGDPNTAQQYKDAVEALYSVAYTAKFMLKKEVGIDYAVMPLEGLWWADNGRDTPKDSWHWTMMIMQPDCINDAWFTRAREQARQKKQLRALDKMRLETLHEGMAAQIMHIGPFDEEPRTLEKLDLFMKEHGYGFQGKHHEIYLSDLRKTAPEKLRTVLRHPLKLS